MASSQGCGVCRQCLHTHVSLHHHHLHHHDDHHHQLHGHFQHQHQHHHHTTTFFITIDVPFSRTITTFISLIFTPKYALIVRLLFIRNPEPFNSFSIQSNLNLGSSEYKEAGTFSPCDLQEQEHEDFLEEEDDEPVFVLTDEWREFFAKSEARRRLGSKHSYTFS
ncbi:SKI/DACH domain-containing protein 1-like [Quillaja saponaria]|uniref:SKI/DACH domain-containing protein 1-like n=1 Tax=Quillaja saponaria TaxID=32244 RepID=A0AAD7PNZ0_QUISA|nr:SKI/DACH domain-containing protein 1-like [Quillaja saponaria]